MQSICVCFENRLTGKFFAGVNSEKCSDCIFKQFLGNRIRGEREKNINLYYLEKLKDF